MSVRAFIEVLREHGDTAAIVGDDGIQSYRELHEHVVQLREELDSLGVPEGSVVALESDFSFRGLSGLLALASHRCIVAPLRPRPPGAMATALAASRAQFHLRCTRNGMEHVQTLDPNRHALFEALREKSGLVLLTSGTTRTPKAVLHDFDVFVSLLLGGGRASRTLAFLRYDHIGGLNTALRCLATGGTLVVVDNHSPSSVCEAIESHQVNALPTTPSFLSLMLVSNAVHTSDLSSLRVIQYSTEVMPNSTLARLVERFPNVRITQAYGMSELGVLRTQSVERGSPWLELASGHGSLRLTEGQLEVKAPSTMLGYLNADAPFTEDGWLKTGDLAELVDGRLRILGRASSMINVGGLKVNPARVEEVVSAVEGVADVLVAGEPNGLVGALVAARVCIAQDFEPLAVKKRIRERCSLELERHEIPRRISVVDEIPQTETSKKFRL